MQALLGILPVKAPSVSPHILVIFDNIAVIPSTEFFYLLLGNVNTHIVIIGNEHFKVNELKLPREVNIINLKPLSSLLTTQRLVHAIMKGCDTDDFIPYNEEQRMISCIAERTGGFPDIVDITSAVLDEQLKRNEQRIHSILQKFCEENMRDDNEWSQSEETPNLTEAEQITSDSVSASVVSTESVARNRQLQELQTLNQTVVKFITTLISILNLNPSEYRLLMSLHWYGAVPIPWGLIEILQSIIAPDGKFQHPFTKEQRSTAKHHNPSTRLVEMKLLRVYPSIIIVSAYPEATIFSHSTDSHSGYYYIPQVIIDVVGGQVCSVNDKDSLSTASDALDLYKVCDHTYVEVLNIILRQKRRCRSDS